MSSSICDARLADRGEQRRRVQAVGREVVDARAVLLEQRRDPTMKNSSRLLPRDAEELDALQQRMRRVVGLIEHALVERQPAQFAVDVQRRVRQVRRGRRGWRCFLKLGSL